MADEWKRGTFVYDVIGVGHTPTNLMNAIQSFLTQVGWVRASWDTATIQYFLRGDRGSDNFWMFNGDGAPQACGIRVELDAANSRIIIRTFLENAAANALQIASGTPHQMFLAYDATAPNNLLFIGGKKGFYYESGRDGLPTNLAHGMVLGWEAVPEYHSQDDDLVNLTTQGIACDLFGALKFSNDRTNLKLCDVLNGNRNYTGGLQAYICRGTSGFVTATQANDRLMAIGSRDNFFSIHCDYNNLSVRQSLGLLLTPRKGAYRISPLMTMQASDFFYCYASGGGNNDAASNGATRYTDVRSLRQVKRFVVVDATLIPFVNLTDVVSSTIYRIAQVADAGRPANIGIEWPNVSNIVTVTG